MAVATDGPNPGYVLIFPPEELKGPFTNMKPTVLLGKDRVVIATKPAAAEKAIALPKEGKGLPAEWTAPPSGLFLERVIYAGDPPVGPIVPTVPVSGDFGF